MVIECSKTARPVPGNCCSPATNGKDPWPQVIGIQHELINIGHNRGLGTLDILIALTVAPHRLTVLNLDDDFASIAEVGPELADSAAGIAGRQLA